MTSVKLARIAQQAPVTIRCQYDWPAGVESVRQNASEAPPRTAKSMGTSKGPCGSLSASSRRDSRSAGRPPPSAAPNRATKAAVVVPPIVAGQAVEPPVWERTKRTLPSPGNLAQVSISQRPRGARPLPRLRPAAAAPSGAQYGGSCL